MLELFYKELDQHAIIEVTHDYKGDFGYIVQGANAVYEASSNEPTSLGIIKITNNNQAARVIEGTFSGMAVNTANEYDRKYITDASFSVSY